MKIAACDDDAQVLVQVSAVLKAENSKYREQIARLLKLNDK